MINNNIKNKWILFILLFFYSFIALLFCSGASPLINELFGDNGYYIYSGRFLYSGNLPYVNYPEVANKGIYNWFVNYLGVLITSTSTFGNFVVEAIFKSIDLCLLFMIFNVFFVDIKESFFSSLTFFAIMLSRPCYVFGNQNEQYQFTGFLVTILLLAKYNQNKITNNNYEFPMRYMFIIGICFSYVFGFKINYILPFVPIALIIVGDMILRKKYIDAIKNIIGGIIGIIIGALPGFLYLYHNDLLWMFYEKCILLTRSRYQKIVDIKFVFDFLVQPKTIWIFLFIIFSFIIIYKTKIIVTINKYVYLFMFIFALISCIMSGYTWSIYCYSLYPYLIPVVYFIINYLYCKRLKFIQNKVFVLFAIFISTLLINMNFILVHIHGFNLGSTFDGMEMFKKFREIVHSKISSEDYKLYSIYPQFYVVMNKVGSHLKYMYNSDTDELTNNIEESIRSLENDCLLISEQEIQDYNIKSFLSENYDLVLENERWQLKCYIKK